MIENFKQLYSVVFDEAGYVRLCGRESCKLLITLANQISPDVNHGNAATGMMNTQAIRDLYTKLSLLG